MHLSSLLSLYKIYTTQKINLPPKTCPKIRKRVKKTNVKEGRMEKEILKKKHNSRLEQKKTQIKARNCVQLKPDILTPTTIVCCNFCSHCFVITHLKK